MSTPLAWPDICRVAPASQVKRARLQALEYKRQYGSPMPSRLLTLAMADAAQVRAFQPINYVRAIKELLGIGGFRLYIYATWVFRGFTEMAFFSSILKV